jgi:hypothetical protein
VPEGLEDSVAKVLRSCSVEALFGHEYEDMTLQENLGLPRPENQIFSPSYDQSGGPSDAAPALRPLDNG